MPFKLPSDTWASTLAVMAHIDISDATMVKMTKFL
jgi:hypothetical protein